MSQLKENELESNKTIQNVVLLIIIGLSLGWVHHIYQFLNFENESRGYIALDYFSNTTYIDEANFTCIYNSSLVKHCCDENGLILDCIDESDRLSVYDTLLFYGSDSNFFSTGFLLLIILLIHNTRMAFGFNLYDRDSTFIAAKEYFYNLRISKLSLKKVNKIESFIRVVMCGSLFLLLYSVSSYDPVIVLGILIFQSLLIAIYLCFFKVVLFRVDTNKDANKFILCTDVTFFIIVFNLVVLYLMSSLSINSNYYIYKYIFLILFGGYFVMFIGELLISYWGSIKEGAKGFIKDINDVYKIMSELLSSRSE